MVCLEISFYKSKIVQQLNWEPLGPKNIHNLKNTPKRSQNVMVRYLWVDFLISWVSVRKIPPAEMSKKISGRENQYYVK